MSDEAIRDFLEAQGSTAAFPSEHVPLGSTSALGTRLLQLFGWGHISANTVQWLAEGAIMDGAKNVLLSTMAEIGTQGRHAGNCRRDLIRSVCKSMTLPQAMSIEVPFLETSGIIAYGSASVLNPLAVLETLHSKHSAIFEEVIGSDMAAFWRQVRRDDPRLLRLNALHGGDSWQATAIPLCLHGDGGRFTKKNENSLLCVTAKSLARSGPTPLGMIPLFFMAKQCRATESKQGEDTVDILWEHVVHILQAALRGFHPIDDPYSAQWPKGLTRDLAGKPLCGGKYSVVIWNITGDLEYLSNELKLNHFSSNSPCWHCKVSRDEGSPYPMTDLSLKAAWKSAPRTCELAETSKHPLFKLPYLVKESIPGDLMHSGDLGVAQYFAGSVMFELTHCGELGETPALACEALWELIREGYKKVCFSSRLTALTVEMYYHRNDWPRLSAKAAETNAVVFILRDILEQRNDGSDHHQHRLKACSALCDFYVLVKDSPLFPTPFQSAAMMKAVERHLLHSGWLLKRSIGLDLLAYPVMVKHHCLWHLADLGKWQNPRSVWCYDFEDYIGDAITAAKSCLAGTPLSQIGNKVMSNFLLVFQIGISMKQ